MITAKALPRVSPESLGISSARVLKFVKDMDSIGNEVHGLMMERDDRVFLETWMKPYAADLPHTCHSHGKSYTCTGAGIAMTEGLLSPDDLVADVFAEEIERFDITLSPLYRKMRLKDLMAMADGMGVMAPSDEYWTENFLKQPIVYEPGTHFLYNTMSSCMLGLAVEKVTGKRLDDYMREKLFDKIGIGEEDLVWLKFADGTCAEPGIAATTEANLRLGMFYLSGGRVGDEQVVSEEWIREATKIQIVPDTMDQNTAGYGWQCWICSGTEEPYMFRFDGGQGQITIADRKHNAAIAFHQGAHDPEAMALSIEIARKFLLELSDSSEALPEDPESLAGLQAYLDTRRIPDGESRPVPEGAKKHMGTYYIPEGDANFWIEVCPYGEDFYHQFWDYSVCWPIRVLKFDLQDDCIMMTVNGRSDFKLRLDGKQEVWDTKNNATPRLTKTCGTAYFEDEDHLTVTVRNMNGWLVSTARISFNGPDIVIRMERDMLHENLPPVKRYGKGRRIR